jgi:hypothetical protein
MSSRKEPKESSSKIIFHPRELLAILLKTDQSFQDLAYTLAVFSHENMILPFFISLK